MDTTFFFYDLETSGFNPRSSRIMQFAGQRTDMDLNPIDEPVNRLIKLTPDILPDPDAVLLTGITPQQTLAEGISESEFVREFMEEIAVPGTVFVGYNSIRFDDEFMRFLLWRNFCDAYEWQWQDGRGRWDLLDVVRMTWALRPEGINWPFTEDGKPTVRLEAMTQANKISHEGAHDALSDVKATMALAQLIRQKQPKLFDYLLSVRSKQAVSKVVLAGQPFVYTSGKYPSEFYKTTVAAAVARHPGKAGALVWDLRHDPEDFLKMTAKQLAERWQFTRDEDAPPRLPVKTLQFNRCPAVAPMGVLKEGGALERLKLNLKKIEANRSKLASQADEFAPKLLEALKIMEDDRAKWQARTPQTDDARLYDGFVPDTDRKILVDVRSADGSALIDFTKKLHDTRLQKMLPLYQARNWPDSLTDEQRAWWDSYCRKQLQDGGEASRLATYGLRLQELAKDTNDKHKQFLLEELQLYAESITQLFEEV